jgi:hypothetical protein
MGARVERLETSEADITTLLGSREDPVVALFAPPATYFLMTLPEGERTYQRPPLLLTPCPVA